MTLPRLVKTGFFVKELKNLPDSSGAIYNDLWLHLEVLDKALLDHFGAHRKYRLQVKLWLDLDNDDFIMSCERANLKPKLVLESFRAIEQIFIKNGQDNYALGDWLQIDEMTDEEKELILNYEEPDWDEKKRKK